MAAMVIFFGVGFEFGSTSLVWNKFLLQLAFILWISTDVSYAEVLCCATI